MLKSLAIFSFLTREYGAHTNTHRLVQSMSVSEQKEQEKIETSVYLLCVCVCFCKTSRINKGLLEQLDFS